MATCQREETLDGARDALIGFKTRVMLASFLTCVTLRLRGWPCPR